MLSIGLVGLPNAGKSTLFNALTKQNVLVADYPFATIDANSGFMPLVDPRLKELGKFFPKAKITPASISFIDIAGLVAGASKGEGLGNQFLARIRETSVIAHVVGIFKNQDNLKSNLAIVETELFLADLEIITKQISKLEKPARNDKSLQAVLSCLKDAQADINQEIWLQRSPKAENYHKHLSFLNLLTLKPVVYVLNVKEDSLNERKSLDLNAACVYLSAKLEAELSHLNEKDKDLFLAEYGLKESGLTQLSKTGFDLLGLQTFLTAGEKEIKAWIIPKQCPAPLAAGKIHSDMEKGFIAVEIVDYGNMLKCQSWPAARAAGLCRTEGKNYQMQVNDIAEFKFNL